MDHLQNEIVNVINEILGKNYVYDQIKKFNLLDLNFDSMMYIRFILELENKYNINLDKLIELNSYNIELIAENIGTLLY